MKGVAMHFDNVDWSVLRLKWAATAVRNNESKYILMTWSTSLFKLIAFPECVIHYTYIEDYILNHNMIVVFMPGFDKFISDFDRFIPGFVSTDSSLLAFLLLEPSPLHSKYRFTNKMFIALYFGITLFYSIWNEYFLIEKKMLKTFINSLNTYFPEM